MEQCANDERESSGEAKRAARKALGKPRHPLIHEQGKTGGSHPLGWAIVAWRKHDIVPRKPQPSS